MSDDLSGDMLAPSWPNLVKLQSYSENCVEVIFFVNNQLKFVKKSECTYDSYEILHYNTL